MQFWDAFGGGDAFGMVLVTVWGWFQDCCGGGFGVSLNGEGLKR